MTHDYFHALIGKTLKVQIGDQPLDLRVVETRMLPPPKDRTAKRAPFAVLFRTEGDLGLRQGTYEMQPPDGEPAIPIFIVPMGFADGGVTYEAVFN